MDDIPRSPRARSIERMFIFACIALVELPFAVILWFSLLPQPDASRLGAISINLGLLCLVCAFTVRLYSSRFHQPDSRPLTPSSGLSLSRAISLVAALPVCAIVLALAIPPTSRTFQIVFPISIIGAVVLLVVYVSTYSRRQTAG